MCIDSPIAAGAITAIIFYVGLMAGVFLSQWAAKRLDK